MKRKTADRAKARMYRAKAATRPGAVALLAVAAAVAVAVRRHNRRVQAEREHTEHEGQR